MLLLKPLVGAVVAVHSVCLQPASSDVDMSVVVVSTPAVVSGLCKNIIYVGCSRNTRKGFIECLPLQQG